MPLLSYCSQVLIAGSGKEDLIEVLEFRLPVLRRFLVWFRL